MNKAEATAPTPVRSATAVRGKYYNRLAEGTNVAILDPALLPHFPDSQSVNAALHAFLTLPAEARAAALQQATAKPHPAAEDFDPRTGTLQKAS